MCLESYKCTGVEVWSFSIFLADILQLDCEMGQFAQYFAPSTHESDYNKQVNHDFLQSVYFDRYLHKKNFSSEMYFMIIYCCTQRLRYGKTKQPSFFLQIALVFTTVQVRQGLKRKI